MNKKKKKLFIGLFSIIFIISLATVSITYYYLLYPQFHPVKTIYVYIDRDDTADSIYNKIKANGFPNTLTGFRWMAKFRNLKKTINT